MPATYKLGRGFTVRRVFEAPPRLVFRAWTDPQFLVWFFNPGMPVGEPTTVDLRVGGQWRQLMVIDEKTRYVTGGVYREIAPPEKLVFTWGAVGGWPELDLDNLDDSPLATVRLSPEGDGTEMIFQLQLPDHLTEERTAEWMAFGIADGWNATLDRLAAHFGGRAA